MKPNTQRRRLLEWLATAATIAALSGTARAESIDRELLGEPEHKLVYQFNKADPDYMQGVLFSVGEMLREHGVVGRFVEFFGPGLDGLDLPDRATISNMCPEYGATAALFPVDQITLNYLRTTGRDADHVDLVERYTKAQGLFRRDEP